MTLYFNRVQNYSQDCSLPYGPMKLSYNISSYRDLKHYNNKIRRYYKSRDHIKLKITKELKYFVRFEAIGCELTHNAVKVVSSKLL